MEWKKLLDYVLSRPIWVRVVLVLAAAAAAIALSISCTRRVYHVKGSAEKVEFEYQDSLYSKKILQW